MIWGSLDPWGTKENPVCTKLKQRKNEATADRKASFIKDAVKVRIMLLISHRIFGISCHLYIKNAILYFMELHYKLAAFIISNFFGKGSLLNYFTTLSVSSDQAVKLSGQRLNNAAFCS